MSEPVVSKFGGTSMAQPEVVADIVEHSPDRRLIVVSAPGTDEKHRTKMTDVLYQYSRMAMEGDVRTPQAQDYIIGRFDELYSGKLNRSELGSLHDTARKLLTPPTHDEAYYASLGEALSARYFARMIGASCVAPQVYFNHNGELQHGKTMARIQAQMTDAQENRYVIPGFYGFDGRKRLHLLGRGGSDRTGALYAAALDVDYENWTDVDGIFSTDPKIFTADNEPDTTRVIPELTREEVREGAHGGSGVLQGDTIVDLNGSRTVVTIKNTNNPSARGTQVVPSLTSERDKPVVAVSGRDDLVKINIHDLGMADRRGYVAELLRQFARLRLAFEHMPAAQDSFAITLHDQGNQKQLDEFVDYAKRHRLSDQGDVNVEKCGAVYVIGEGLRNPLQLQRVTARILNMAADMEIDALPVVGTHSPSLAILTGTEHVTPLVKAVHHSEIER